MTFIRRAGVAAGTAVLLSFALTACGDDDGDGDNAKDAPADVSQDTFCDAWNNTWEVLTGIEEAPSEDEWEEFQDSVADLGDAGTPEDISEEERNGYEVFVKAVAEADYDDSGDFETGLPGVSGDEQAEAEAFISYAVTSCTDIPTEIPTDLPTDIPTE